MRATSFPSRIEADFPTEELTPIVTRETNRKPSIYQMHKWWARRPSSVFRMLLISAFADERETRNKAWAKFSEGPSLQGKVVLDCMMGGGSSIIEALRLGGKVVGVDINPVAWFVTKKEVEPANVAELQALFKRLEQSVGKTIRKYYATECLAGHPAEIMYTLWNKSVDCGKCGNRIDILQDYLISERKVRDAKKQSSRTHIVVFCPHCREVFGRKHDINTIATCPSCKGRFKPRKGTVKDGSILCRSCHYEETMMSAVKRKGGPLEISPFCIEYYCKTCDKRVYKRPADADIELYRQAKQRMERLSAALLFPRERIREGHYGDHRPQNHGYGFFYELFNGRQLLCLSLLLQAISKVEDKNAREFLLLAFSSSLETNNLFCKYETRWHKCSSMFGLPGYHPVDRIAENNVWGTQYGRGTFSKCYQKMIRGKVRSDSKRNAGGSRSNEYFTRLARSFSELESGKRNALVRCQNSESLDFIPDASVDAVVTDPPYFDNLDYSRLADFFYVWLRIILKDEYESFKEPYSARSREVVMNGLDGRTAEDLVESLTQIFGECKRVLKPGRPLVFTFHHSQGWAWKGLMTAICNGGFSVVACHFVRSEGRTGLRTQGHISYDACLVCRKSEEVVTLESKQRAAIRSKTWIRRLFRSENGLEDSDVYPIVMGNMLAYTPELVLDGFERNGWVKVLLDRCIEFKNNLASEDAPKGGLKVANKLRHVRVR